MDNIEKVKRERRISIIALIIAFITLVIGFMAYSGTIKIEKELKSNDSHLEHYNIGFSILDDRISFGYIEPYIIKNDLTTRTPIATNAELSGTLVKNIRVHFYEPGQYVYYKFFVYNAGKEDMYLNDILFKDIPYTNQRKICEPKDPKDPIESVQEVCDYITLGVLNSDYSMNAVYGSVNDIKGVKIKSHEAQKITVIVAYETGAPLAPTPLEVYFGDIQFKYSIYK